MITEEALKQYRQFEKDFAETSKHICELLIRYDKRYKGLWEEFEIFDEDCYKNKFVECTYYTSCMGEVDIDYINFPLDLLFMTDEEIEKWIDSKIEEDRDMAEYARIQKKYNLI